MNEIIRKVLEKKQDILEVTMNFEYTNLSKIQCDYRAEFSKVYNFFDSNFSDDEIVVIQSIMYFGRECYPNGEAERDGTIEEIVARWMKILSFSFGKRINRQIEIDQMVEKGLKIGTYFKLAFEYFEK